MYEEAVNEATEIGKLSVVARVISLPAGEGFGLVPRSLIPCPSLVGGGPCGLG